VQARVRGSRLDPRPTQSARPPPLGRTRNGEAASAPMRLFHHRPRVRYPTTRGAGRQCCRCLVRRRGARGHVPWRTCTAARPAHAVLGARRTQAPSTAPLVLQGPAMRYAPVRAAASCLARLKVAAEQHTPAPASPGPGACARLPPPDRCDSGDSLRLAAVSAAEGLRALLYGWHSSGGLLYMAVIRAADAARQYGAPVALHFVSDSGGAPMYGMHLHRCCRIP
jgi:hypothetical protein